MVRIFALLVMWLGTVLIHTLLIYCRSVFLQRTFSSLSQICHKLSLCIGYPIGFFNFVIPTQNFEQSRNPEGYFWHPTSQAYFQSRDSPRFYFQIPNPELQISPNKGETAVHGCHCQCDTAVRMREVLARSWVFVFVPLALSLSSSNKGNPGSRKTYLGPFL